MDDERAVFVRDPERPVRQCDQPFGIVAVRIGRQLDSVEIDDPLAARVFAVHASRIGTAGRVRERDDLFENRLTVAQPELADAWLKVRQRLDERTVAEEDVRTAIREPVDLVVRPRHRIHRGAIAIPAYGY